MATRKRTSLVVAKGRKRQSLPESLARLHRLDPSSEDVQNFFKDMEVAKRLEIESLTFRHHALATQKRQDRILETYRGWAKVFNMKVLPPEPTPEEIDLVAFPPARDSNYDDLLTSLKWFLFYIIPLLQPRSMFDEVIGYGILVEYRMALSFWVRRKFDARKEQPPPSHTLFNSLTQAIRLIVHETQMKLKRTPKAKSYLGLLEIVQLIDMDTRATVNIALAEGHHLAWLLARCCALRPGAIGTPQLQDPLKKFPFLKFGDFAITRHSDNDGKFDMVVAIRNLKITTDIAAEMGYQTKRVEFHIKAPSQQHNLMLSIPHRFLVLALRRGALEHYTTIEGLLSDNKRNIRIKKEFLDKPVVVAGTHRGLDVEMNRPASAQALTHYISIRGQRMGYSQPITFYSIRRRAGTDLSKTLGREGARTLMCHEPDSLTLEKFYLDYQSTTDVTALGLGEQTRQDEMEIDSHKLALNKLTPEVVTRLHGRELNAAFRQVLCDDEEYAQCKTLQQRRNRERVLRRSTLVQLTAAAREEQESTLTTEDYAQRKDELFRRAVGFNKQLLARIKAAAAVDTPASNDDLGLGDHDFDDDFFEEREAGDDDDAQEDLEDQLGQDGLGQQDSVAKEAPQEEVYSEKMANYVSLLADVPYKTAVQTTMALLLENGLGEYTKKMPSECPLCLDDDTIREEDKKYKIWAPNHLPSHIRTDFHSPGKALLREIRNKMTDEGAKEMVCPFCVEVVPDHDEADDALWTLPTFTKGWKLTEHFQRSQANRINRATWTTPELAALHYEAMKDYGVFDQNFWGSLEVKKKEKTYRDTLKRVSRPAGDVLAWSKAKALPGPIPLPGHHGIVMGSFHDFVADLNEVSKIGPVPSKFPPTPVSLEQHPFVIQGRPPGASRLRSMTQDNKPAGTKLVPFPGTEGGFLGQGNRFRDWLNESIKK